MILQSITLENIRSYKEPVPIEIAPGTSLFEGDVGCGKSTILSGVEFALFGLGDQDGRYLLRNGEKQGSVLLGFEVNGKHYQAYRSLSRRGKNVSQKEGYIVEDGTKTSYSVGEMKARILDILDFKERIQPKTSSVIYRYAVFTPQEMMKEVLSQSSDKRIETLRRAFGIEEYSWVSNNSALLSSWQGGEIKTYTAIASDLEQKQQEKRQKQIELGEANQGAEEAKSALDNTILKLQSNEKSLSELEPTRTRLLTLQGEIPKLNDSIQRLDSDKKGHEKRISELEIETQKIAEAKKGIRQLKPLYRQYNGSKKKLKELEPLADEYDRTEANVTRLEDKIKNIRETFSDQIKEANDEIKTTQAKLIERRRKIPDINALRRTEYQLKAAVKPLKALEAQIKQLGLQISGLQAKISANETQLREKKREWNQIKQLGYGAPCPRCKQKLTKQHYETVEAQYKNEFVDIERRTTPLRRQKSELTTQVSEQDKRKVALESKEQELSRLSQTLTGLKERKRTLDRDEEELKRKTQQRDLKSKQLQTEEYATNERIQLRAAKHKIETLKRPKAKFEPIKQQVEALEDKKIVEKYKTAENVASRSATVKSELESTKGKLTETNNRIKELHLEIKQKSDEVNVKKGTFQQIETLTGERKSLEAERTRLNGEHQKKKQAAELIETRITEISGEIERKESAKRKRDLYDQGRIWLNQHFIPAVEDIERHVLIGINEEFNNLFSRWFSELLETGDISVRIDENFTPIIEQGGYELDVQSLSGGEKTSVALAYRLALNVMVKKVCNAMQSSLLILDEPTDGFSKEQLGRLRDVLRELGCEQVIIVSHEKELESFVDRVYHIEKQNGITHVGSPVM